MSEDLLDAGSVVAHLRGRGVLVSAAPVVRELGGGVSNVTMAIDDGAGGVVVKQALGTLRVRQPWNAPRGRIVAEAEALRWFGRMTPGAVPRVVDLDEGALVLVIEQAPRTWQDWRQELFDGTIRQSVARRLGEVLATWHEQSRASMPGRLTDDGAVAFEALRVEPFHRAVARALPDTAEAIATLLERMARRQVTLVHGDFSPKNVLVDPAGEGVWVIDMEVAHRGDPTFDVAFLLTHLQLKAIAVPGSASGYDTLAEQFLDAYRQHRSAVEWDDRYLLAHVGALLLARVHGVSPADYLDHRARATVTKLGRALLAGEVSSIAAVTSHREEFQT